LVWVFSHCNGSIRGKTHELSQLLPKTPRHFLQWQVFYRCGAFFAILACYICFLGGAAAEKIDNARANLVYYYQAMGFIARKGAAHETVYPRP
jgi:hypothetical protein